MPSPARRGALIAGFGVLALALLSGPGVAAGQPNGQGPGTHGCDAPGQAGSRGAARCDADGPPPLSTPPAGQPDPPSIDGGGGTPEPTPEPTAPAPTPS